MSKTLTAFTALSLVSTAVLAVSGEIEEAIRQNRPDSIQDAAIAAEQARIQARTRSADFGLEFRPSISEDDIGAALRIYLPGRWEKKYLRQQLELATQTEQLRTAQFENDDVLSVYRDLCAYRLQTAKISLIEEELSHIETYLQKINERVENNQFNRGERTRLYSEYLDLLNDLNKLQGEQFDTVKQLQMVLGPQVELSALAPKAIINLPSEYDFDSLFRAAMTQRLDYQRFDLELQSMQLAENSAQEENRFRFKYIQPSYQVDPDKGKDQWSLSTAIVLPWGKPNPDIAFYKKQQTLTEMAQTQKRQMIALRLHTLLNAAKKLQEQDELQKTRLSPILNQLNSDLQQSETLPLEALRGELSVRKSLLNSALQSAEFQHRKEMLAIQIAEELGSFTGHL